MKKSKVLGRKNSMLTQIRVTGTCKQQQRVKKHQQTKANSNNYRTRPDSLIDRVMEKSKVLGRKNSIVSQIKGDRDLQTAITSEKIAYLYLCMPTGRRALLSPTGSEKKRGEMTDSAPFLKNKDTFGTFRF